jgi:hypothetical protein
MVSQTQSSKPLNRNPIQYLQFRRWKWCLPRIVRFWLRNSRRILLFQIKYPPLQPPLVFLRELALPFHRPWIGVACGPAVRGVQRRLPHRVRSGAVHLHAVTALHGLVGHEVAARLAKEQPGAEVQGPLFVAGYGVGSEQPKGGAELWEFGLVPAVDHEAFNLPLVLFEVEPSGAGSTEL